MNNPRIIKLPEDIVRMRRIHRDAEFEVTTVDAWALRDKTRELHDELKANGLQAMAETKKIDWSLVAFISLISLCGIITAIGWGVLIVAFMNGGRVW